jgi:protein TonB
MIATPNRRMTAVPRRTGVAGSLALHGALAIGAACVSTGVAASAFDEPPDTPLAVRWAPAAPTSEDVVAAPPKLDSTKPIAPPPAPPDFAGLVVADVPVAADLPSVETPTATAFEEPELHRDLAARVPGRRSGGGSGSPGDTGGLGASSIGVGGRGGPGGGSGGVGDGGGVDQGRGDGAGPGDGVCADEAPRRGATRGPMVVGALPAPRYPSAARSRGWEGRVVLLLSIDAAGRVLSAEVAESSGRPSLDDAALAAARDWTFAPALCDDAPVAGSLRVPVRFSLDG